MKKLMYGVIAACTMMVGCSDKPTLYVYNWSDYVDENLVKQFEAENDCNVLIDSFDDNETMLAKMMAGATGYDVVFPSSYMIPTMVKNGLIGEIDKSLLPNVVSNLDYKYSKVFHENTMKYSVPYALSATGIAYRKDVFTLTNDADKSWNLLKNPAFKTRVTMLNDIREMIGIGLHKRGYSANTKSEKGIQRALEYIKDLKPYARKLDNVQYRTGLVSGEYYIAIGYTCDLLQVMGENPDSPIAFFIPKEGSNCCWDEFVIPANANRELAHKFIDFLYRPDIAAKNAVYICATVPNVGMWKYMESEYRDNEWMNLSLSTLNKLELIEDVGDALPLYNKAWDEFTAFGAQTEK